jgi:ribonuclease HI
MARSKEVPKPLDEEALTIFVDGSMRQSPRRGGIGIRFAWIDADGNESEPWDHALEATPGATNQQMELEAPYQALRLALSARAPFELNEFDKIEIRTDSQYAKDGIGRAINYWSKNRWHTREGNAVLNVPDWKNLLRIMRRLDDEYHLKVQFEWKKGKKGRHALAVDQLAKQSSDSPLRRRPRPVAVRRKLSEAKTEVGSVGIEGQTMDIRIVEARHLGPPHNRTRYRYEVVDEGSPYVGKVDFAESDLELTRGHSYLVTMNDIQATPRIVDVIEEVEENLGPFIDALRTIGYPASAREVAEALAQSGIEMSVDAVKRRGSLG